jgi:hypothetical protein
MIFAANSLAKRDGTKLIGRKLPENSLARRDNEDKVKQDETQLSAIKTLISRAAEYPQKELNRSYLAL